MNALAIHRILISLVVGLGGGLLAVGLNAPLPYLLGAIASVALLQVTTGCAQVPQRARELGQVILGVAVGLYFTMDAAEELSQHIIMMVIAAVASVSAAGALAMFLSQLSGVDRTTAYFASLPGGVSEMSVLAERFGGQPGLVAAAQTLRLTIIVFVVPFAFILAGAELDGGSGKLDAHISRIPVILLVFVVAFTIALLLSRARVMNSWFLAGLFAGAGFALWEGGLALPSIVADAGQWLIGTALGARLHRGLLVSLKRFLPLAIIGTLLLIAFNLALALALSAVMPIEFSSLVLATVPGGVAEMSIIASNLALNVPAVTTFHVIRIFLIVVMSAPMYRLACWLVRR